MTNGNTSDTILPATLARLGLRKDALPPGAETQQDQLLLTLTDQEWSVRATALRALGKLGVQASSIEPLTAALRDESDVVRAAAAHALGTLKERMPIEPLVLALHDTSWRVRTAATLALGTQAPIAELVALVDDEDASVCIAAVQVLGEMGERAPVETLLLALNDQDWSVREAAAMALGNSGRRIPVEPLLAALQDKDAFVRQAALQALERTHPERLSAITPPLERESESKSETAAPKYKLEAIGTNIAPDLSNRPTINLPRPTVITPIPLRPRPTTIRQRFSRRLVAIVAAALVIVSLAITLVAQLLYPHTPPLAQGIGGASFGNSQQDFLTQNDGLLGFNDELQIDLFGIHSPATSKSYYGWLLDNKQNLETTVIALGKLPFSGGKIYYLYKNPARQNLLLTTSYFLITEEDANVVPLMPTPNRGQWRYSAEISRTPNPADTIHHYSLFDHIQHLLAKDPTLDAAGLQGGLGFWLVRNSGKVSERAQLAQQYWQQHNVQQLREQVIGILDYLDGVLYVQNDVPPGTPLQSRQLEILARIGLLTVDPNGYLQHIEFHLNAIVQNPDASKDQKALATRLVGEINKINAQCEMVHQDARQLVNMTDAQLLQVSSLSLLKDMTAHGALAFAGSEQAQLEGAMKVFSAFQSLASFDVEAYRP